MKNHVESNFSRKPTSKRKVVVSTAQIPRRPRRVALSTTKPMLVSSIFPCESIHLCNFKAPRTNSKSELKFICNGLRDGYSEVLLKFQRIYQLAPEIPIRKLTRKVSGTPVDTASKESNVNICCEQRPPGLEFKVGRRRGSPEAKLQATSPRSLFA